MIKVAPSILAADFTRLKEEIISLDQAGADYIHIDIMDGHFVPNLSFGADIIKQIRPLTNKIFDVHLMVSNPEDYVIPFKEAKADILTFHIEAAKHQDRLISYIKSHGMKVGVALNPATEESCLKYLINDIDLILVMTVNPGFGGQKFLQSQIDKIKNIKENYIKDLPIKLEVDGGINNHNAKEVIKAGADVLVAGSYILQDNNYASKIMSLKNNSSNNK